MKNEQFVQVPTLDLRSKGLEMKDVVVYAYLKKHYNNISRDSFPSFDTLVKESGISKPTIMKSVSRLEASGYITIQRENKVNHYRFSNIKKFEIYSFEFLDDPNLDTNDKAYMICMQPYMFKNSDLGIGKVTYSEVDVARTLGIDLRTLRKYEAHLQEREKPILTVVPTQKKDPATGLMIQERIFDFTAYNNLLALKFNEIDERLNNTVSKEDYDKLLRTVQELEKRINTQEVQEVII